MRKRCALFVLLGLTALYAAAQPYAVRPVRMIVPFEQRSPAVPDTPTIAESGVPGYDYSTWYGLCGVKLKTETQKWANVVRAAKIAPQ
jgi:tripartite-type tricarboxylate transporter receptor subunit TctC